MGILLRIEGFLPFLASVAFAACIGKIEFWRAAARVRCGVMRTKIERLAVHNVTNSCVRLVGDAEEDGLRLGPAKVLHRIIASRPLAAGDADADLVKITVEQVLAMSWGVPPAGDEGAGERWRREAVRIVLFGNVLGDQAVGITVLADTLRGALSVRCVAERVGAGEVIGKVLSGAL